MNDSERGPRDRSGRAGWITAAALAFCIGGVATAQDREIPSSSLRIHVETQGGETTYTVYRSTEFKDKDALARWLLEQKGQPGKVVLQADGEVRYRTIAGLFEKLSKAGYRDIQLATTDAHESWWQRTQESLHDRPIFGGSWLIEYYGSEFGEDAKDYMWRDLERALCEHHLWLAMNLIDDLPDLPNGKGKGTYFAARPSGDFALSDAAVEAFVTMMWYAKEYQAPGQMAIDLVARIQERRAAQFLIDFMNDERRELWDRFAATRALQRLRHRDAIVSGQLGGWIIPPGDGPEEQDYFKKEQAKLNEWWKDARNTFPPQVLPRERGGEKDR